MLSWFSIPYPDCRCDKPNNFTNKFTHAVPYNRGANPQIDFAKFSEKLHEIEKFLDRRGRAPGAPPLDTPLLLFQ